MGNKAKKNLSIRAKSKGAKIEKKNKPYKNTSDALITHSKPKSGKNRRLKKTKSGNRKLLKVENDFVKLIKEHSELKLLKKYLVYLGLSVEDFLEAINLKKFLATDYNPKGTINEIFVLNDKVMINILKERADATIFNLTFFSKTEIGSAIGNAAKKVFNLKDFENLPTIKATDFRTMPDNKLYLDFSMVRYDGKSKKLFLVIPGEIKEPKAASELAEQFGRFIRRLEDTEDIHFKMGNKDASVSGKDVFFVRDNFVGIARRKSGLPDSTRGKNISEKTPIMEIVNLDYKNTKPESNLPKDKQEFVRFLAKLNPDINPDKIQKILIELKTKRLKLKHKVSR